MSKPIDDDALLGAIRQAVGRGIAHTVRRRGLQALRDRYASRRREQEVTALVVSGVLNKRVGYKPGISEVTVKAHRGRVMLKMEGGSLVGPVKRAETLRLAAVRNPWQAAGGHPASE